MASTLTGAGPGKQTARDPADPLAAPAARLHPKPGLFVSATAVSTRLRMVTGSDAVTIDRWPRRRAGGPEEAKHPRVSRPVSPGTPPWLIGVNHSMPTSMRSSIIRWLLSVGGPLRPGRKAGAALLIVAGTVLLANAAILAAVPVSRQMVNADPLTPVTGITHLRQVDGRVWRGDAPSPDGYRELARRGVSTVVDLRAERDLRVPTQVFASTGMRRVAIPIRDGQTPSPADLDRFTAAVHASTGLVYVHCGAGVGRSGAMAAAYLVRTGGESAGRALLRNLSVGPPSAEQIWFAATLDRDGEVAQPPAPVSVVSRVLDGPRRTWSRIN